MALTERFENDKIEVVGQYKAIQVRRADIIERDGVEVTRSFHRHVLHPGTLDENCLLYTSPSPRDKRQSRMPSSA